MHNNPEHHFSPNETVNENPTSGADYYRTQTPEAKTQREENKQKSLENIADSALEANERVLENAKKAITEAQKRAENASFITRWIYEAQVNKLKEEIRYREAAISARRAQLEKQGHEIKKAA